MRRSIWMVLALLAVSACGDPPTEDRRGYTKAPLERPGLVVQGEEPSEMAGLGETNRPRPPVQPPEPAGPDGD